MPLIPALEPSDSEVESLSDDDVSNNYNTGNTNFYQHPLSNEEADELRDELLSSNDVSNNDNSDDSHS
jgi:hypothetical protein